MCIMSLITLQFGKQPGAPYSWSMSSTAVKDYGRLPHVANCVSSCGPVGVQSPEKAGLMKLLAWCVCLLACSARASIAAPEADRQVDREMEIDLDLSMEELTLTASRDNLLARPASFSRKELLSALAAGMLATCVAIVGVCEIGGILSTVSKHCWQKEPTCELAPNTFRAALAATVLSLVADLMLFATVLPKSQSTLAKAILSAEYLGKMVLSWAVTIMFWVESEVDNSTYGLWVKLWAWILAFGLLNSALVAVPAVEHCRLPAGQPAASSAST